MGRLFGLLLLIAGVIYPFAVYYGMEHLSPQWFAACLGVLWLARALAQRGKPGNVWMTAVALTFCLLLGLSAQEQLLRWYPALLNALLMVTFALSLKYGPPLIERLARIREPHLPEVAIRHTRRVTQVWALFFLFNGLVVVALNVWAPLSWWTLYTGLIAYGLMGLLFVGEWLVRQHVRRHE